MLVLACKHVGVVCMYVWWVMYYSYLSDYSTVQYAWGLAVMYEVHRVVEKWVSTGVVPKMAST